MRNSETQERYVTEAQLNRLSDWSRRKPVIALMGEFSAGKSTLMNLLIGQNILPTQVTATQMPPVWIRYGSGAPSLVDHAGKHHPVNLGDRASIPVNRTKYIRLYCEADILKQCDLIDTPGISDPNIPVENWIRTIRYANAVMWCTHACQAWRESERGAWEALPKRLRQTSILLATRKDKITSELDRSKIGRRLERETQTLFSARMFISLTNAIRARQAGDSAGWAESGAQEFSEMLARIVEGISVQRSVLLERYVPGANNAKPQGTERAAALIPDTAMAEEGLCSANSVRGSSGEPGMTADLHEEAATLDLVGG
ncbi:dynamin family protein [Pseudogemmobacter bohemicus]|uniref:dynamin family protein n=1 Tax=Pseudogemmobacter bohemicus TaxID=2250708 RepID=UPI000DD44135|nr:dynamin family protein [Pseudogemmobacter bohemicus]